MSGRSSPQSVRAGLVLVGLLITGCAEDPTGQLVPEQLQAIAADNVLMPLEHYVTIEGVRTGFLLADTAFVFDDSTSIHLRNYTLTLYNDSTGVEKAQITAGTGVLNSRTDALIARRDVVLIVRASARSSIEKRIETQELHYDPALRRIWSDSATVLIDTNGRTTMASFQSDLEFTQLTALDARGPASGGGSR